MRFLRSFVLSLSIITLVSVLSFSVPVKGLPVTGNIHNDHPSHPSSAESGDDKPFYADSLLNGKPVLPQKSEAVSPIVQIVLYGPYSNLAKKYLWQSFFEIWDNLVPATLHIVAAGRDNEKNGNAKIQNMVQSLSCGSGIDKTSPYCDRLRTAFLANVTYVSVGTDEGYVNLGHVLRTTEENEFYMGRLFYMAVATDIVPDIFHKIRSISQITTHELSPQSSFSRIILEKPIGSNFQSSSLILGKITGYFSPASIYIMDHYLGKTGVQLAAGFRKRMYKNEAWSQLLQTMIYSEAFILEDETCEGRTGYYNEYGAVRDMMQNHMLQLVASSFLSNGYDFDNIGRETTLRSFQIPSTIFEQPITSTFDSPLQLIQYKGYKEHFMADKAAGRIGFNASHVRDCRSKPYDDSGLARSDCMDVPINVVSTYEKYGENFTTITGISLPLAAEGSKFILATTAKAAGVRSAFVRQIFMPNRPTMCGPMSITFHIQGKVILPSGVNASGLPFPLPHDKPAIIITAVCGNTIGDPLPILEPLSWPFDWDIQHSSDHGIWIATPIIHEWTSAIIAHYKEADQIKSMNDENDNDQENTDVPSFPSADDTDADDNDALPARVPLKVTRMSKRILNHRLKLLSDAPSGKSVTAYRGLIAAGLLGSTAKFVTTVETQLQWTIFDRFITHVDAAINDGNYTVHEVGSIDWMRNLISPSLIGRDTSDRFFGIVRDSANFTLTPPPGNVTVYHDGLHVSVASLLSSDIIQALWSNSNIRPFSHMAFDGGYGLGRLYGRISQVDVGSLGPWPGTQLWTTRERDLTPHSNDCVLGYVLYHIMSRTRMDKKSLRAPYHPNVTHHNSLAHRILSEDALDIILTLFPAIGTIDEYTAGRTITPAVQEALDKYGTAVLGDDSKDLYVSSGIGIEEAIEQLAEARDTPGWVDPSNPEPDANLLQRLPPNVTIEMVNPYHNLPPPPIQYRGKVDIRLSRYAFRSARHVFVVLPLTVLKTYQAREAENIDSVFVNAEGQIEPLRIEDIDTEVVERMPGTNAEGFSKTGISDGHKALPKALLEDLGKLVGGRHYVKVYIEALI